MSVRAYKLLEIKTKEESTFNLWSDEGQALLDLTSYDATNEGGGLIEFSNKDLEQALKDYQEELEATDSKAEGEKIKAVIEVIKKILKESKEQGDDYINYYCY